MSAAVRVQLLGPVRARRGGDPLALRGTTARTVLARLALSAGSVVGADQLADALWHDDPPLEPSASIRSIVSRLRSQLGRDCIVTDGAGYRLDLGLVQVDLAEIELGLNDARPQRRTPEELRALLDLWDGDALTDVAWTPAFEPERVRIAELRARLLDAYHESMIAHHRSQETLADLERDAAAAPLRESTQLLLMRALDACGRTPDAVRSGDTYRTRLIDQTGLDPSPEYVALTGLLLSADRSDRESATAAMPANPVSASTPGTWLPPDTPFVGRETELDDLATLVDRRRLVTITGPGGVGKTRLVTEFFHGSGNGSGVEMVGLASLAPESSVDTAVATALGIEVSANSPLEAITERLASGKQTLVLDNCEHVLASARTLVQHLLRRVEGIRIITTSRRRMGLPDEAILDVGPLALPATNVTDNAPMRLFLDRVERVAPRLEISDADRAIATDICRLLDGLPLALELAAVRVPMFGFEGLRQRLVDGLSVPGTSTLEVDRRQATMESTVAWSLALLTPEARHLFDEISAFPSWFDLAGVRQVSNRAEVVDAFTEIHDSSLVVVDHQKPAYRLLEPVRQVAHRQIDPHVHSNIVDRYLSWVAAIIDSIEQDWLQDRCADVQRLIVDHRADIRWTLNRFIEQGDAEAHGRVAKLLSRALVERADIEIIALCRVDVGKSLSGCLARLTLAWAQGDLDAAVRLIDEIGLEIGPDHERWSEYNWAAIPVYLYHGDVEKLAQAAAIASSDPQGDAFMRAESVALWVCGLLYAGRRDQAVALMAEKEHILELSECQGFVAYTRAEIVADEDPDLAMAHLEVASAQARAANNSFTVRLTDVSRLVLLIAAEQAREATALARRLIPELTHAGTYPQAWTALRHIANLLRQLDEPATALLVLDSAHAAPSAAAVTGDAIEAEAQLRSELAAQVKNRELLPPPLALAPLWDHVEEVLRPHVLQKPRR